MRRPEGFDESTVRTISENSRTLKFEPQQVWEAISVYRLAVKKPIPGHISQGPIEAKRLPASAL
jgi:hypothetical protein